MNRLALPRYRPRPLQCAQCVETRLVESQAITGVPNGLTAPGVAVICGRLRTQIAAPPEDSRNPQNPTCLTVIRTARGPPYPSHSASFREH